MTLKQIELASRLGIDRSAVSKAVSRGRLEVGPDGLIDLENPVNAEYVRQFSAHRGRSRPTVATQVSPNRLEARRRRALAALERARQRTAARRAAFVHREFPEAYETGVLSALERSLPAVADRVDLTGPDLERALELEISSALQDALDHGEAASKSVEVPSKPEQETINHGATLDETMALLDLEHEARLIVDREIHDGALVSRTEVRHRIGRLGEKLALIRQLPRRYAAQVGAALTDGPDAARSLLRQALENEIERLRRTN